MARSTSTTRDSEDLVENLRALIAEAEKTLAESASETTHETIKDLKGRLDTAKSNVEEFLGNARAKVTAGAKQADTTIRAHPYESLAIALGVGVLLGALLRRH